MKKLLVASGLAALLALIVPTAANAQESPQGLDPTQISEIQKGLTKYGVDTQTQNQLIAKLSAGKTWDSFTEAATPVKTETTETATANETIETYADGSITVSSLQKPNPTAATNAWGCTYQSAAPYGGYWKNCDVTVDKVVLMMGFYLDYQNIQGSGSSITRYWGYHYRIIGGSLTGHRLERLDSQHVRYSTDFAVAYQGFPVGWTAWMQANLSGSTITTSNN